MRLRWLASGAMGALLICLGGSALPQTADPMVRPAKVMVVEQSTATVERRYPGSVLPSQEVEISFRVSGRVIALPIRGAMEVAEGDVIAQLDPRDFESQVAQLESQRDQAEAQLVALRAGARAEEITALEAAVAAAEAQLDQARDQAERTRTLASRGVVSSAQRDQDEAALRVAEATLRRERESLAIGRAGGRAEDIAASEAALRGLEAQLQIARDNLDDATLRAPFAGIIARRDIENFSNIQAGMSVALIQAIDVVHVAFDVPSADVTALTRQAGPDQITNTVSFDALPELVLPAEVVEFSTQADRATQTYRGRVAVTVPADTLILPGMVGQVTASAPGAAGDGVRIPLTALGAEPDGAAFVWRLTDENRVAKQPVTLGAAQGARVTVTEGLEGGETIVTAGVSRLIEGQEIRPVTEIGG